MRMRSLACNLLLLACIMFTSCVIPPPTEHEGGFNTPPQVEKTGTSPELDPSKVFPWHQTNPEAPRPLIMTFTIRFFDPDPEKVFMRFFLNGNYRSFLPTTNADDVGPVSSGFRTGQAFISGLCDDLVGNQIGEYDIDAYLSDSGFVNQGEDLRKTLKVDGRQGNRDHARWRIDCQLPKP